MVKNTKIAKAPQSLYIDDVIPGLAKRGPAFWSLGLGALACLFFTGTWWSTMASGGAAYAVIGPEGYGRRLAVTQVGLPSLATEKLREPRVNVLETDTWKHSLDDGSLDPVASVPLEQASFWRKLLRKPVHQSDLLHGAHFTPAAYLEQIKRFHGSYTRQRDILMYFGGVVQHRQREGLNFNAWSVDELKDLRARGCRPFIGLETMHTADIRWLAQRLHQAGYGPQNRIYIRIGAEPSGMPYGTEDGTTRGRHHTAAAYAAYKRRFTRTAEYLNEMNRVVGLDIHTVFAGFMPEDFEHYCPPTYAFDALGFDLYLTPSNKALMIGQLARLSRRFPHKPLVIPEFGIATGGPANAFFRPKTGWADPTWAAGALGETLQALSSHHAGVEEITVFSVNVAARLDDRRWNWAWSPLMFEMLKEWKASPGTWQAGGVHHYDPNSYPVGRNVFYVRRDDLKILYRRLAAAKRDGRSLFQEIRFTKRGGAWIHRSRIIYFRQQQKIEWRPNLLAKLLLIPNRVSLL